MNDILNNSNNLYKYKYLKYKQKYKNLLYIGGSDIQKNNNFENKINNTTNTYQLTKTSQHTKTRQNTKEKGKQNTKTKTKSTKHPKFHDSIISSANKINVNKYLLSFINNDIIIQPSELLNITQIESYLISILENTKLYINRIINDYTHYVLVFNKVLNHKKFIKFINEFIKLRSEYKYTHNITRYDIVNYTNIIEFKNNINLVINKIITDEVDTDNIYDINNNICAEYYEILFLYVNFKSINGGTNLLSTVSEINIYNSKENFEKICKIIHDGWSYFTLYQNITTNDINTIIDINAINAINAINTITDIITNNKDPSNEKITLQLNNVKYIVPLRRILSGQFQEYNDLSCNAISINTITYNPNKFGDDAFAYILFTCFDDIYRLISYCYKN
jgi:hypothetical protein